MKSQIEQISKMRFTPLGVIERRASNQENLRRANKYHNLCSDYGLSNRDYALDLEVVSFLNQHNLKIDSIPIYIGVDLESTLHPILDPYSYEYKVL